MISLTVVVASRRGIEQFEAWAVRLYLQGEMRDAALLARLRLYDRVHLRDYLAAISR